MRKLVFGLLLGAAAFGLAAPANAQGFWFGVGPFGFGVGATPYYGSQYYGYDSNWAEPGYAPYTYSYPAAPYAYQPAYSYEPYTYYPYGPDYAYAPGYTWTSAGYTPNRTYRSYAYAPRTHVYRTRYSYTTVRHHHRYVASVHRRHHARVAMRAGLNAQASVPVHHRHHRHDHLTVVHRH